MSTTTVSSAMISSGVIPTVEPARNFIIDGDFLSFPEGNKTAANNSYGPALFKNRHTNNDNIQVDMTQSTTVPTVAQSGHQSKYSFLMSPSTAESALATDEFFALRYVVTGTDFTALHQQAVTLNFWVRSNTTGTYYVCFTNSAEDRSYPASYTISSADTWEEKTITLTLDTSGTWLFTEADKGLQLYWTYGAGSDYEGTANAWQAGIKASASGGANLSGSTSNNLYLSQVGLYLGSSAPSSFVGEPLATVKDQVSYYVQRWDYDQVTDEHGMMGAGHVYNTSTVHFTKKFDKELRVAPSVTFSGSGTFEAYYRVSQTVFGTLTAGHIGKHGCRLTAPAASGSPFTAGDAVDVRRDGTDVCFIMADARH